MGRQLEQEINRRKGLRTRLVHVLFIPAPRNQLLNYLDRGLADVAMGGITVTLDRLGDLAFTVPFIRNSEELLVTGPLAPDVESIDDLAGKTIFVQPGGNYLASVEKLNEALKQKG